MNSGKIYNYVENDKLIGSTSYAMDVNKDADSSFVPKYIDLQIKADKQLQTTESPRDMYDSPKIIKVKKYRLYKGK